MAVAHSGTDTNGTHKSTVSSVTWSHTNAGDFISVMVAPADGTLGQRTVSTVTFNADACTHAAADADAGYERTEIWYRFSPDVATGNVVVTMGGTCDNLDAYAASFSGANQSALDNATGDTPAAEDDVTSSITVNTDGSFVISVCQTVDSQTSALGGGQSQIGSLNGGWTRASYSGSHTAGSVTHTYVVPGSNYAAVSLISIKPPAGTTYTPTYTETTTLSDTLLKSSGRILSDTTTLTDSMIRSIARILSDTVTHTDTGLKSTGRALTDTVTHTDTITTLRTAYGTFTDTLTHTDTIIRSIARSLTDTITHTDTFISLRTAYGTLTETSTISDTITRSIANIYSETITHTDTLIKSAGRILSDVLTHTDTVLKETGRILSDTITHSDVLDRTIGKLASETVSLTDTIIRSVGRILTDTITHTDTVLKSIGRILTDAITHTDTFEGVKITEATLSETTTLSDTIIRSVGRILTETVNHTDTFIRDMVRVLTDSITHTDTVTKSSGRVLTDTLTVRDGAVPAMSFNGTNALVTFGNILTSNTVVTAAIRLIPLRNSTSNYDVAFGYGNLRWFFIFMGNTTRIAFNIRNPSTEQSTGYPATALTIGKRYTVIGTYDPSGGANNLTIRIYDEYGALVDSASSTKTGALGTTVQPLQIAHDPNRNFWMGMVARDARVWGRVLTTTEQNNFALEVEPDATDLLLKVTADEGNPATTVADTSPTGATGTLTNVTWVDFKRGLLISLSRALTDTTSIIDSALKTIGRILTDETLLSDIFDNALTSTRIVLYETITVTDTLVRSIGKMLSETASIIDTILVNLNGTRWYVKLRTAYNSLVNTVWESHNNTSYKDNNNSSWYTENDTDWKDPL